MKTALTFCILFLASVLPAQILITEIMYNPPESNIDSLEYIELHNAGNNPVNLMGWSFPEGIVHTFDNQVMAPGEYLIVCVNLQAFSNTFGGSARAIQWTSGALNNSGEAVSLANAQGTIVFRVVYANGAGGWYSAADGNGASLELCNANGDPNDARKWRASENATGIFVNGREVLATPGLPNSTECDDVPDVDISVGDFFFTPADITIDVGQSVRWTNTGGLHNVNGSQATYPLNPAGFTSGQPSASNWTYTYTFDVPGFYRYRCDAHPSMMQGTVTVRPQVDPFPLYSIAQIRGVDQDGVADSSGVSCSLRGVVHGINQRNTGVQLTLIDADGDGIGLFSNADLPGLTLVEGDSVRVWGTLGQFRGLLQMSITGVERLAENQNLVPAREVTDLNEETESRVIIMRNMKLVDDSQWSGNPDGFNVDIIDEQGGIFSMRIGRNVQIPTAPTGGLSFDVTGIGGQFSGVNAPWLDGYQILPRYQSDINSLVSTKSQNSQIRVINVLPNPFVSELTLDSKEVIRSVHLRNLNGQVLLTWELNSQASTLWASEMPAGVYLLECHTDKGVQVIKAVKSK